MRKFSSNNSWCTLFLPFRSQLEGRARAEPAPSWRTQGRVKTQLHRRHSSKAQDILLTERNDAGWPPSFPCLHFPRFSVPFSSRAPVRFQGHWHPNSRVWLPPAAAPLSPWHVSPTAVRLVTRRPPSTLTGPPLCLETYYSSPRSHNIQVYS